MLGSVFHNQTNAMINVYRNASRFVGGWDYVRQIYTAAGEIVTNGTTKANVDGTVFHVQGDPILRNQVSLCSSIKKC